MLNRLSFRRLALLSASLFFCAFQWPWETQTDAAPPAGSKGQGAPAAPLSQPQQVQPKPQPALQKPSVSPAQAANIQPASGVPQGRPQPKPLLQGNVIRAQQKVQEVIRLNEKMNKLNRAKIVQVQAIVDQSRAHQRLLAELSSPPDVSGGIKTSDADQVLMQQKLRTIREQTEKRFAAAQGLQKEKKSASPA